MHHALGVAFVAATWSVSIAVLAVAGSSIAVACGARNRHQALRLGLWWGLGLAMGCSLALAPLVPLASLQAIAVVTGVLLAAACAGLVLLVRLPSRRGSLPRPMWLAVAGPLALAAAALGPVTNYDSGLYHLGAIAYAAREPSIPGLANVYEALGSATAQFPLAALLEGLGWGGTGARLVNGLLLSALVVDLLLRWSSRRRGPGAWILAVGVVAAFVPMVGLADYWVTSPSQDAAVLALTVASAALLAEATVARHAAPAAATAMATAVMTAALRPTMGAFAVATLCAAVVLAVRRHVPAGRAFAAPIALAGLLGAGILVRDAILSGWLLFPSSAFPLPVDWRSPDPAQYRLGTLGFHRDPQALWQSIDGWSWVPGWVGRQARSWEAAEAGALWIAAASALVIAARAATVRWRAMLVALLPSSVALVAWFAFTPPSPRFAWGPILMAPAVVLGWAGWRLETTGRARPGLRLANLGIVSLAIVSVACIVGRSEWSARSGTATFAGLSVPVAPVEVPAVREIVTTGGVVVEVPEGSEQCWSRYPLCTPRPVQGLAPRGPALADGFTAGP